MNTVSEMCDKPLTGAIDTGPDIVDVPRASQRVETAAGTLPDIFCNLAFPETASAHGCHSFSHELSPAA